MSLHADNGAPAATQRLFFAIWPDAALQRRWHALAELPAHRAQSGRRTPRENLHVTLAFLGSVSAERRACLERAADAIRAASFELTLDRLGSFRRGGVWWLAPSELPPASLDLVAQLKSAQEACGLVPESRAYRAHITLARDVRRCPPPMSIASIVWPVRDFVLVQSKPGEGGSRYQALRTWPLA